jgi:FlaA1/EpsC-like NDP-sugar epimerase
MQAFPAVILRPDSDLMARLLGTNDDFRISRRGRDVVRGNTVLITGAGGSIGSELARQVHRLEPARLFLLDHDESALHALALELTGNGLFEDDTVILCDIRDEVRVARLFARVRPDLILHAAAHKHLPLLERYPAEGVKTNVFGTATLIAQAVAAGVSRFVNVSTDKAARPTSVLGATKRLAEMVVSEHAGRGTDVASVRFGNVLGSRGSFLPGLMAQVEAGRPITVTDPDVTRFFMSIPQAAKLVIEAAAMATNGETYVLDMGRPVRILDLVERYLEVTGLAHPGFVFTGLRPGEKLHEELLDDAEADRPTVHRKISCVRPRGRGALTACQSLPLLSRLVGAGDDHEIRTLLMSLVPTAVARTGVTGDGIAPARPRQLLAIA